MVSCWTRLDDSTTPSWTDELDTSILYREIGGNAGKDAVKESMRRLLSVMANVVVGTDLRCCWHKLDRDAAEMSGCDARVGRWMLRLDTVGTSRLMKEKRLSSLSELIERGIRGIVRELGVGVALELAIARCLAGVERLDRNILTAGQALVARRKSRRRDTLRL